MGVSFILTDNASVQSLTACNSECFCVCDRPRPRTYCLADSDEESSSAGSSDEEDPPELLSDKAILPGAEG